MSYDIERKVLSNYLEDQNFFGFSPFGLDGGDFEEAVNAGKMEIMSGAAHVRSIGGPSVLVGHPGVLSITFLLDGGSDSSAARVKAQEIIDALFELKLDETGSTPSASSDLVIDFGFNGNVPSIASLRREAPHLRTTVNASFLRTQLKTRST